MDTNLGLSPVDRSLRKFLFLLVEDRISRGDGDEILAKWRNHKDVPALRSLGYIEGPNRLTDRAFSAFFQTFERIECPDEIQKCTTEYGITGVQWRRAKGVFRQNIRRAHGHGVSYPTHKVVFIKDGADLPTWYHELGHIIFQSIKHDRERIERLALSAKELALSSNKIWDSPGIAEGSYILIDGRYLGLDHSGSDAVEDEIWAVLFERYHCGTPPSNLLPIVREIIASVTPPKPIS